MPATEAPIPHDRAATDASSRPSFGRCCGNRVRPSSLANDEAETQVPGGGDNRPDNGGHKVQPCVSKSAGRDHRAECPRGVKSSTGESSAHENVESKSHSDRERR